MAEIPTHLLKTEFLFEIPPSQFLGSTAEKAAPAPAAQLAMVPWRRQSWHDHGEENISGDGQSAARKVRNWLETLVLASCEVNHRNDKRHTLFKLSSYREMSF